MPVPTLDAAGSLPPVPAPPVDVAAPPVPVPPLDTAAEPPDAEVPPEAWAPPVPAGESLEDDPHAPTKTGKGKKATNRQRRYKGRYKGRCKRLVINIVLAPPGGGFFARSPVETRCPGRPVTPNGSYLSPGSVD